MKKFLYIFLTIIIFLFFPLISFAQCRAYRATSQQTIADSTPTKVQFNAEDYDPQEEFDSTTNYRFTATKLGYYLVTASLIWTNDIDTKTYLTQIYKNGTRVTDGQVHGTGSVYAMSVVTDIVHLAANDYIEIYAAQYTGESVNIINAQTKTFVAIYPLEVTGTLTLIRNEDTGSEFYIDKTFSYGDILISGFLSLFLIGAVTIGTIKFGLRA